LANVASAEKRNRQRQKRRQRNLAHKTRMRGAEKRVRVALAARDARKAQEALRLAVSLLSRAAQRGVIKPKTASRHISRLTSAVTRLSQPAPAAAR
jgi:small subunit ribosomal protein S20